MYGIGMMKTAEASIPVISVGNIAIGGTGKTPVVERLSTKLKESGFNPGIVTRGYKRKMGGTFHVDAECNTAEDAGDEAFMLAKRTKIPVIVGIDRAQAIELGVKAFQIDVALLDDGFQTLSVKKDMEILILNGKEGKGSNGLFPLGPYREPLSRIKDADVILVNKGAPGNDEGLCSEVIPAYKVQYKPAYLYNVKKNLIAHYNLIKDRKILAFSGLGDNESFFNLLKDMGADVVHEISYPDHYAYERDDIEKLLSYKGVAAMVTTEKDAVKIAHMDVPVHLYYLAIDVVIEREQELLEHIVHTIEAKKKGFICQKKC